MFLRLGLYLSAALLSVSDVVIVAWRN